MSDIMSFSPLWGEWQIKEAIGKGTTGTVYRALREEYGKTYVSAIKHIQIPPENVTGDDLIAEGVVSDESQLSGYYDIMRDRQLNEISTMYDLRGNSNFVAYEEHKIIPRENKSGYDIFIRMEYLLSLPKYLSMKPMSEADTVRLGIDICKGLETLEKRGIVHRDIKIANIFVTSDGTFKLGDFGESEAHEKAYGTKSVRGTYSFMPPEVARGESFNNTTDIYSLGMVMYRLLNNNRAPFLPAPPMSVTNEMLEESNRRRLSGELLPAPANCCGQLSSIVLTACAPSPNSRFQSASALKNALLQCKVSNLSPEPENGVFDDDKTVSALDGRQNYNFQNTGNSFQTPPISGVTEYKDDLHTPESKEKKKNKALIATITILCLLIAGALTAFGIYAYSTLQNEGDDSSASQSSEEKSEKTDDEEQQETTKKSTVSVPSLKGMSYEEAIKTLSDMGLNTEKEYKSSDEPVDTVISQNVKSGEEVKPGSAVKLVISKGPEYTQKIVVKETGGNSGASLTLYNWDDGWHELASYSAKVGKSGISSNYGENSTATPKSGKDGFALGVILGEFNPDNSDISFLPVDERTCVVCDTSSDMYNTIKDRAAVPVGVSTDNIGEKLTTKGENNYCIYIEHNGNGIDETGVVKGKGSVITICGCYHSLVPTNGCIDISASDMDDLISMLEYSRKTRIIIQ